MRRIIYDFLFSRWFASLTLAIGVLLISYHGWWVIPGAFLVGWFTAWAGDR